MLLRHKYLKKTLFPHALQKKDIGQLRKRVKFFTYVLFQQLAYCPFAHNLLSLSELLTTETELMAMAPAAKTGFKRMPKKGYNIPAAMGIPRLL